jgi:histidine triad (HIT) family protein
MDCLFCKIAHRILASDIVYEDESVLAFNDIHPKAPIHQLIIPRKHIATVNDIAEEDKNLIGHLYLSAQQLAKQQGVAESGYRLVMNCNKSGGQEVYHIHLHFLAKRQMTWPPG